MSDIRETPQGCFVDVDTIHVALIGTSWGIRALSSYKSADPDAMIEFWIDENGDVNGSYRQLPDARMTWNVMGGATTAAHTLIQKLLGADGGWDDH